MLTSLRQKYGDLLLEIPISTKQEQQTLSIYSFPTLEQLKAATEDELRQLGFGYRAKFIISTRDQLLNLNGEEYLMNLRHGHYLQENYSKQQITIKEENSDHKTDEKKHQKCNNNTYHVVQEELLQFSGIGRKVADCIALFSLDQSNTIPVDVHVQHIASRDYDPTLLTSMNTSTLTPTIYKRVGDLFRERFGTYAGWAHSLLFVAELPSFRDRLPYDIVEQMDKWKEYELEKKVEKKNLKKKNKMNKR
jgi:N-glycosylase/DNA lyase